MQPTNFPSPRIHTLPIHNSTDVVPVGRIYCVGRNYADHAIEMGKDPSREPPFFFTKFTDTLIRSGSTIPYPPATNDFQFEAELVVVIKKACYRVSVDEAKSFVFGYACGIDLTRRDLQMTARAQGRPWDMGKNFSYSAPVGTVHQAEDVDLDSAELSLTVNGVSKQHSALSKLIWSVPEIVSHLSGLDRLMPGDIVFTGTPAGVGPVVRGDKLQVSITGLTNLNVTIAEHEEF